MCKESTCEPVLQFYDPGRISDCNASEVRVLGEVRIWKDLKGFEHKNHNPVGLISQYVQVVTEQISQKSYPL